MTIPRDPIIRYAAILLVLSCFPALLAAQPPTWQTNGSYLDAERQYAASQYLRAALGFEAANLELSSRCSHCLAMASRAYGRAGRRSKALSVASAALTVADSPSERSYAHLQRGSIYLETREDSADLQSAGEEARLALNDDPQNIAARLLLGLCLLRQGREEDGVRELQVVETSPAADAEMRAAVRHWIADPGSQRLDFAPNFRATTITGEAIELSRFRGKVVLLDFWATWCAPCRAGLPDLKAMQERYQDRLVVLSLSVDDDESHWRKFVAANAMTWPQLHDADVSLRKLFHVEVCPTYILLDGTGVVRFRLAGISPDYTLSQQLDPALERLLP